MTRTQARRAGRAANLPAASVPTSMRARRRAGRAASPRACSGDWSTKTSLPRCWWPKSSTYDQITEAPMLEPTTVASCTCGGFSQSRPGQGKGQGLLPWGRTQRSRICSRSCRSAARRATWYPWRAASASPARVRRSLVRCCSGRSPTPAGLSCRGSAGRPRTRGRTCPGPGPQHVSVSTQLKRQGHTPCAWVSVHSL